MDSEVFTTIKDDARQRLLFERRREANLAIEQTVRRPGESIIAQHQEIPIERDTIVVFHDEEPLRNWGHACRYTLYDPDTATPYREVAAQFPPSLIAGENKLECFHEPIVFPQPQKLWTVPWERIPRYPLRPLGSWYAVLYSGASDNRHTNDLEFLYRVLRDDYRVPEDNIYVLNYDGTLDYNGNPQPPTAWPGDGSAYRMPVNAAGTKSELDNVLDDLKNRLRPEDSLLIHTNNHGGRDGSRSYLCTYSGPGYYEDEFGAKLAELPGFRCLMVMMEQCFSGGFNQPIIDNSTADRTSVASAAIATQTSIGGAHFDPFARDWIAAMHRHLPDGGALASNPDSDGSGSVSAREAFDYADSVHHPHDTPIYSESSAAGGRCRLGARRRIVIPDIPILVDRYWWRKPYPLALEELSAALPELEDELIPALERELAGNGDSLEAVEALIDERLRERLGDRSEVATR